MRLEKLIETINNVLPPETSIEGDRCGLQLQSDSAEVHNILFTLELTDSLPDEAKILNADCIICFHPLIYKPITSITNSDRVTRILKKLIQLDVSLIVVHTNFDAYKFGTSYILAQLLGLKKIDFLIPDKNNKNCGIGTKGEFSKPINAMELIEKVSKICNSPIKYNSPVSDKIRKVSIVGGSGSSFINEAISAGSDVFITADVSYHHFHAVGGKLMIIDPGHYEMEQFVPLALQNLLKKELKDQKDINFILSRIYTNPVRYFAADKNYNENQHNYIINLKGI